MAQQSKRVTWLVKHVGAFVAGFAVSAGFLASTLWLTGHAEYYLNNVLRLSGLATADTGSYSMSNLFMTFFRANYHALVSGTLFWGAALLIIPGVVFLFRKKANWQSRLSDLGVSLLLIGVSVILMRYSYKVVDAPPWPQMSTGPTFVSGVFYVMAIWIAVGCYQQKDPDRRRIYLLALLGLFLSMLTIAGSNTGIKHTALSFWILGPLAVWGLLQGGRLLLYQLTQHGARRAFQSAVMFDPHINCLRLVKPNVAKAVVTCLCIVSLAFGVHFIQFVYQTNNFDAINRLMINTRIESPKLQFIWTTERQAEAVAGVMGTMKYIDNETGEDRRLIVYGNAMLMYYLTDKTSYINPWITTGIYSLETIQTDIQEQEEAGVKQPIFLFCRTSPAYGFAEEDYEGLIETMRLTPSFGKRIFH